eukprot:6206231-Pleurochrysis_carterae.AAC.2
MVSGPEDPKLVALPRGMAAGPFALAFSSIPPQLLRPECRSGPSDEDAVHQMYIATEGAGLVATGAALCVDLQ